MKMYAMGTSMIDNAFDIFVGVMVIGISIMFVGSVLFMLITLIQGLLSNKSSGRVSAAEQDEILNNYSRRDYTVNDMEENIRRNRLDDLAKKDHYAGGDR